jgi:hypothetical protein
LNSSTQQIHIFERQRATPSVRPGPCRQPRLPISRPRAESDTISPAGVTRFCNGVSRVPLTGRTSTFP